MYRMPEKQSGSRRVSNCARSCFYQYANHLPNHLLSIELKYPDFFYHFSICFVSFYIILCKLSSFMRIYAFKRKKTSRKRCVYNHRNSYLFRFTNTYMQITVHPPNSVRDKMSILNSQMLAFLVTLFILAIKIFISKASDFSSQRFNTGKL